ncbi:uncharacterized protein wu:fa56d06 isoform X3 [Alosa alosa]|uniref:uncharacterized protein wu:fa56d06 isoform X3 n=1 Tax=Alosa alosa TaxID=278164 RepID=UPI0020150EA4|nr:uncharacterized protein wu:fa56d06 isoform X3 [Alosa alosa]
MLKLLVLLTLAIIGHDALPLRKVGTGRVRHVPPHRPMMVPVPLEDWQVVVPHVPVENHRQKPVRTGDHAENHRQGTEPSRRFLVDLNTGLLKDYVDEMSRRPSGFYVPPRSDGFRQGTENSQATLVDPRTGQVLQHASEIGMREFVIDTNHPVHADEFSHSIEYSWLKKKDTQGKDTGKIESEVVAVPLVKGGWVRDALSQDPIQPSGSEELRKVNQVLRAASEENRRQGTEPSRRFLVDLNTGLLKDYVDEMNRRPSGFYVPPHSDGFRQGTENSQATLVDVRTGLVLQPASEMRMRGFIAGNFHRHAEEAKRESDQAKVRAPRVNSINTASVEENRRQGTEPSRRFLVDLNTGLLKDYVDEMSRRPSGFYVPPRSDGFRQGTENSQATLVDVRTGLVLQPASEMRMRGFIAGNFHRHAEEAKRESDQAKVTGPRVNSINTETIPVVSEEFKHGMEYTHSKIQYERHNEIMGPMDDTANDEFSHSLEFSHFKKRNDIMGPARRTDTAVWLRETLPVGVKCSGEIIDGRCYQFNPTPLTFSKAESFCQDLYAGGHIAAVTSADLHKRLVSMVTVASNGPTLTWLGGVKKAQQYEWMDGSTWGYTDWMPGHPNLQRGRGVTCVEMFRMEASWWTSVDCNLKRASICSFPMAA